MLKKYTAVLLSMLLLPILLQAESNVQKKHRTQQEKVKEQRENDKKRKEEILKQMRDYMKDINSLLKDYDTELIIPIDPDNAEDMEDMYDFHDRKDVPDYYIKPADGKISSKYGTRTDPFSKKQKFHSGIDIAAKKGTPIYAAADGVINKSDFNKSGYGNLIIIDHGNDIGTWYAHLNERLVSKNKKVKKGELIGKVGSTGNSTGPHLHFEVRKGGNTLNPEDFLK